MRCNGIMRKRRARVVGLLAFFVIRWGKRGRRNMTREEKQQIKEREKEYIGLFKQISKKYEMKYKANTLFFYS